MLRRIDTVYLAVWAEYQAVKAAREKAASKTQR